MRQETREAIKGLIVGVSVGSAVGLVLVSQCGCALDWTPPDDDAGDDYDRGEADTSDEDDGWTDPAGEDGGVETDPPVRVCDDSCGWPLSSDGVCEDGGTGSESEGCTWGTDCTDCGARYIHTDGDVSK